MTVTSAHRTRSTASTEQNQNFFLSLFCLFSAAGNVPTDHIDSNCENARSCDTKRGVSRLTSQAMAVLPDPLCESPNDPMMLKYRTETSDADECDSSCSTESTSSSECFKKEKGNKRRKQVARKVQAKLEEFLMLMSMGIQLQGLRGDGTTPRIMLSLKDGKLSWRYSSNNKRFCILISEIAKVASGLPMGSPSLQSFSAIEDRCFHVLGNDSGKTVTFITPTSLEKEKMVECFDLMLKKLKMDSTQL